MDNQGAQRGALTPNQPSELDKLRNDFSTLLNKFRGIESSIDAALCKLGRPKKEAAEVGRAQAPSTAPQPDPGHVVALADQLATGHDIANRASDSLEQLHQVL